MDRDQLQQLQAEASGYADDQQTSADLTETYDEAEALFEEIDAGDLGEWLVSEYRQWYREWKGGEADPPCNCSNPRCPLKQGQMFYEIRRSPSRLHESDRVPLETRIRRKLNDHPEATVLDEKVRELEQKKREAIRGFREVIRTGSRQVTEAEA